MRLDKYLAHAGIGTRKEVKQLIRKKRVCVNGDIVTKDDIHIDEVQDQIEIDGLLISYDQVVYIMLHKPCDVVSAVRDELHTTVMDCIDVMLPPGCFPVGRLDIDTEGLLLITNDGQLSHCLLSPKHHIAKTYYVELEKPLSECDILTLEEGSIVLDDEVVQKAEMMRVSEKQCYITIYEGKFHQVKRMFHAVNNEVLFLKRVSMGSLKLDEALEAGQWRYLQKEEVQALFDQTR